MESKTILYTHYRNRNEAKQIVPYTHTHRNLGFIQHAPIEYDDGCFDDAG
jgi:hypothetical protein